MEKGGEGMKIKLQWHYKFSGLTSDGDDLWQGYVYLCQLYEPTKINLRIWQLKFFWLVLSIWWKGKPREVTWNKPWGERIK